MYKAIIDFVDLRDSNYRYHAGDVFPRTGYNPGAERIAELVGTNNKRGCAVIAKVAEKAADKPVEKPKKEEVEILTESVTEPEKGKEKAQKASAAKPKRKGRPKKE